MIFFRTTSIAFLLAGLSAFCAEPSCPDGKRPYRFTLRHIESGGIGYDDGYTTLEAFLSHPSPWIMAPFLDVRGHVFDNGKWAANAGVGLRGIWGNRIYGLNTYYDYRDVSHLQCNQMGVGLETLGERFDFRINGYFPFGKKTSDPWGSTFGGFSGHHMLISQKFQVAMTGTDAEFGFHFGKSERFDFYAALGPYFFLGDLGPNVWGGKARIAGKYKDLIRLQISNSYDTTFRNRFQGEVALSFSIGPKSKVKRERSVSCELASTLNERIVQPVDRQEIIVVDQKKKNTDAIDPATGLPYYFVFVNNMSSSDGTYESPYPTLAQAEAHSSPNDIIYVFPGDGTTTGMNSGITLQDNQKFWGSGISYSMPTTQGTLVIPPQSSTAPTITNTDMDTEGNAITLAAHNVIRGVTITSATNNAIHGTDLQNLEIASCTIDNTIAYAIEATFSDNASISLVNNQFVGNSSGVFLTLNATSSLICANNTFQGQTSIFEVPLAINADSNTFTTRIENNVFNNNMTGSIRFNLTDIVSADIDVLNNRITNNNTGSQSSLGSSLVLVTSGTTNNCSIDLKNNTFSTNTSNSLYLHTSGEITNLEVIASANTMSGNGGSALVLATPVDSLTLLAIDNTITDCSDNAIAAIATGCTLDGTITINNNTITDIGNMSNGIAVNQNFLSLDLTIQNNEVSRCEGTGVISYSPSGIHSLTMNISGNTISHCENMSSNAAAGIDIEQYIEMAGTLTHNTLSDNTGTAVTIGSSLENTSAYLIMSGNDNSGEYTLINPPGHTFRLSPYDVQTVNTGTLNLSDTIDLVQCMISPRNH